MYDEEAIDDFIESSKKLKLLMKLMFIKRNKESLSINLQPPIHKGMDHTKADKVTVVKKSKHDAEKLF